MKSDSYWFKNPILQVFYAKSNIVT